MTMNSPQKSHHLISLQEIAGWQNGDKTDRGILARVPSLQRGLVWDPQQIEMLWDSLFRGFPVGAIVLSQKIEQQDKHHIETTHHILDGQQRCYAISLGFNDPWLDNSPQNSKALLWLDLSPGKRLGSSTRKFLFRVTTAAHPWGFHHGDSGGMLSASNIREFLRQLVERNQLDEDEKRPALEKSIPHDAGLPVPLSLLMHLYKDGRLDWDSLATHKLMNARIDGFANRLRDFLKNSDQVVEIENGLALAQSACILALQVPVDLRSIHDIEQIFQRLNRQGTPLDNEELAYSMIKAYWPEVEEIMQKLPRHHTTEARMIAMSIRVALTAPGDDNLHPETSVDQIRKIFGANTDKSNSEIREKIKVYFKGTDRSDIVRALQWIDDNLLYKQVNRKYGIPPYLRSSIAWSSREVFSWLMLVAKRCDYRDIEDESLTKRILGLALSIHWFGRDKKKAVDFLVKNTDISMVSLSAMKDEQDNLLVVNPLDLETIKAAIPITPESSEAYLKAWTSFWHGIVTLGPDGALLSAGEQEERKNQYWPFFEKLVGNREILVYAQRAYFGSEFTDFDPSNKLVWKGHNRPWDYDHILPSNNLDGRSYRGKAGEYHAVCKAWQQSLGNLVAVDFSFNREAQDNYSPSQKYENREKSDRLNGFFDDVRDYDLKLEDTRDTTLSRQFVVAARNRLIALYGEWFEKLSIEAVV